MDVDLAPFAGVAAAVAGILAAEHDAGFGSGPVLVVGAAALAAAWCTHTRARFALATVACALLGGAVMTRALDGQRHSPLSAPVALHAAALLPGELTTDPAGPSYAVHALVRVAAGGTHRTVLVTVSAADASVLRALEAGDHVVVRGRFAPLRSADDRARWAHAVARLDDAEVAQYAPASGFPGIANALRTRIERGLQPLAALPRALTGGFLLGDTRAIPPDVTVAYRDSGLSHLLAVSGENVAFALALVGPVLRRLRLGARTAAALAVVTLFAAMTRFEPSVLRASMMAAIALLAAWSGRPASASRVLAYAVIVLLLADPFLVHSVAFLLSCGASAGITFFSAPIAARLRGPRWLRDALGVSLAAQLGVLPVLLWAFGNCPAVTPLANLLAMPAAEVLGVYGFVAAALAASIPATAPLVHGPTVLLVRWITAVARAGAAMPLQLDAHGALGLGAVSAAGASIACLRARRPVSRPPPG